MELRRELMPPVLDGSELLRLAKLADRLDGAPPGVRDDDDLALFNQLAGTDLLLEEFQGIYKSEESLDWVRRLLFQKSLIPDADITQQEMAEIVSRVTSLGPDWDFFLELFLVNCKHPSGTDLIYWPDQVAEFPQDREPTAEEIAALALRGRV